MVVAAAQRENMEVVPEGGSLFTMDMTLIQDGNPTLEHNIPLRRLLRGSSFSFWSQTKTNYTPTLVVTYGGPAGDPYWRQHTDVWRHPLLSRHAPPAVLAAQNTRRTMAPEEDYVDADSAREAKKLADRGVQVSIGAHGQQAGLGAHWEMWSFVRGGWSPIEALRAGDDHAGDLAGLSARHRLARGRQARRPGRARRRSDRRHPQQRQGPSGDARRPSLRPQRP